MRWLRRGLGAAFWLALFVLAITARVVVAGELELAASTDALLAGDAHEATVRARRAATWYAPGAPHVRVAYDRLEALALEAEQRGRRDVALLAWEGVRGAVIETEWLLQPHAARLARANEQIARLRSTEPRAPGVGAVAPERLERALLATLARRDRPRAHWIALLAGSFACFLAGLTMVLRRGIDDTGRLAPGAARWGIALSLLGMAGWLLSLSQG